VLPLGSVFQRQLWEVLFLGSVLPLGKFANSMYKSVHVVQYLFYHTILLFCCAMAKDIRKKRIEALQNRKNTLFKKAYKLGQLPDVNSHYYTYRSTEQASWPPDMEQIVSYTLLI
jgi:hypothetical protein